MELFADVHARAQFSAGKMRKNNLFDTPRMFCDVYCLEPGQEQSAHAHSGGDKVYFLIEGSGRIRIGDDERDVRAGTAALAPAGTVHAVRNTGIDRMTLLVFMAPKPT